MFSFVHKTAQEHAFVKLSKKYSLEPCHVVIYVGRTKFTSNLVHFVDAWWFVVRGMIPAVRGLGPVSHYFPRQETLLHVVSLALSNKEIFSRLHPGGYMPILITFINCALMFLVNLSIMSGKKQSLKAMKCPNHHPLKETNSNPDAYITQQCTRNKFF